MKRRLALVMAGLVGLGLGGCPEDKFSAKTWTAKLDDPREAERAVTELEQLGDPSAIPALGEAWVAQGKPARLLQVIISLARPLTPEEAKEKFVTDFEKEGRKASWDAALPFLTQALTEVDKDNPRSVDSATKAADALGEAKLAEGLDALISLGTKAIEKKLIQAQVAAIRAIGKYDNDKDRASDALIKLIDRSDMPAHPKTAKEAEQRRALEEKYGLYLGVTGAAINSLAELRAPKAALPLTLSLFRTPELFTQIRRALAAAGPQAKAQLRKVLQDQNAEVNQLFKDKRLDKYCGDRGDSTDCQPVSAKDFYPAVVLGDFYDPGIVGDLLVALKRPPLPVYYMDDAPSPNTQYHAIFDSLRKIGASQAAEPVRKLWIGAAAPAPKKGAAGPPAADTMTQILAISAYPFLARDQAGVVELAKIAGDNNADDTLRQEAATAYARLARSKDNMGVLNELADKYFKASAEKTKEANGKPKTDADAADKVLEKHKKVLDEKKMELLKVTKDPSKTAADIKEATKATKKFEDDFKAHKKTHREATAPYKNALSAAKAYKGFARMFQTHIARIEIAIRCQDKLECYADALKLKPEEVTKNLAPYIKDIKDWTKDEILGLQEGNIERAMLELGKRGQGAKQFTDLLLDHAKTDNRLIRQSILLALPKIATLPCKNCEAKLEAAIKAGEGKTTLGDLNLETTMLRNYFAWADGSTTTPTPVPADTAPPEQPTPAPAPAPKKPAPKKKGR